MEEISEIYTFSEETKRKIGAAQKGKKVSKETREKLRNAILGKKREPYKKKQE
jgi:plasmid stability protein